MTKNLSHFKNLILEGELKEIREYLKKRGDINVVIEKNGKTLRDLLLESGRDETLEMISNNNNNNNSIISNNNNSEYNNTAEEMIPPKDINELSFSINFAGYSGAGIKNTYESKTHLVRYTDTSYTIKIYFILREKQLIITYIQINNGEKLDQERHIVLGNDKSSIQKEEQKIHSFELTNNKYPKLHFTIKGLKYSMRQCLSIDELNIQSGEKEYIFKPENLTYTFEAYNRPDDRCKQNVILQMSGGKRRGKKSKKTRKVKKSRKAKKTRKH